MIKNGHHCSESNCYNLSLVHQDNIAHYSCLDTKVESIFDISIQLEVRSFHLLMKETQSGHRLSVRFK